MPDPDEQRESVSGVAEVTDGSSKVAASRLTALLSAIQALEVHRTPQRTLTALAHAAEELLACTGAEVLFRGEGRSEWQSLRPSDLAAEESVAGLPADLLAEPEQSAQASAVSPHGGARLKARVLKVTRSGVQSEALCFRIDAARNSQERDPLSFLITLHRPPGAPFDCSDITAAELLATHAALQLDVRSSNAEIRQLESQLSASRANEARWRNLARLTVDAATEEFDALSYSVSHDLRAPVRHVNSFVALLRKGAGDSLDDSGRRYLDIVDQASQRLGRMVDGLLDLSRMNRAILSPVQLELRPAVLGVIEELVALHPSRTINWKVDPLPRVLADRELVRLAFRHLLTNAVKFTAPRATAEIEVGAEPGDGAFHLIYVRDNGVGFDPNYRHNLFRIFQRLHHASDFAGIGIGLACVRSIIQRHGGKVGADSTLGQGARFYVSLPKPAQ